MVILLWLVFIGVVSMPLATADKQDLLLVPVTYVVFPTSMYNKNSEQQHTNCSNTTMDSYMVLVCGEESILADGNKGNINTADGLQAHELQQYFIWNVSHLNAVAPFVSIVFKDKTIPHSVDLYFHTALNNLKIDIPKITLYWSNKDPVESKNVLPFQRMAYVIGNGMYKYKIIVEANNSTPFSYMQIKMEPNEAHSYSWIFLSEIKTYTKKSEVGDSTNQINLKTIHMSSVSSQVVTPTLKSTMIQATSTSSQMFTVNPTTSINQITSTPNRVVTVNPVSPAATEVSSNGFTVTTTSGFTTTKVTMETITSLAIQTTSQPQVSLSSMTHKSPIGQQSSTAISLAVTKALDTTGVPPTSSLWLPLTMSHVIKTETTQLLPSTTPTVTVNRNISVPDEPQVTLVYPPKDKTVKVTVTQNDPSIMLNCTISGSNLTGIEMSWIYNEQMLMNDFTELLNGQKVSFVLAELPGVYKCIVQSMNGVIGSEIAGIFEVVMPDIESATTVPTATEKEEPFSTMVIGIGIGIGLITVLVLSIIIIVTMVIWRRPHNEDEENNRSSTISTKPVKEDEMTYLKFLKANSVPPPVNMSNTMKTKNTSLDHRVSRPTLLPPKTLSKDLDHIHFSFFQSHLSYFEVPPDAGDLPTYNDDTYAEIDLNIYEDMHSVSTRTNTDFDEYVDMSFRGRGGNSPAAARPFSSIYATPRPLKKHEAPANVGWDNIQVITQLGKGVFGEVLLAQITKKTETLTYYQNFNKLKGEETMYQNAPIYVVVKVLDTKNLSHKLAFENEIKFMSRLDNDNVIRMLGICNKGTPFIMMEYMENGDLQSYLQKHCYSNDNDKNDKLQIEIDVIMYIVLQICNGMKYLADQNFIHRDLAARNCQVGLLYLTKISDFGISQTLNDSNYYQYKGNNAIPVRWMPTESFYGKFSIKSDVWAFGVTMWEVFHLGRRQPYDHKGDQDVVADAMKGPCRLLLHKPTQCPYDVYRLMLQCWVHEPQHRPNFEELYQKLYKLYMQYQ